MEGVNIYKPHFTRLVAGQLGAEGPVFNAAGTELYMVAPEVEVDNMPAGQVLRVDTSPQLLSCPSVNGYGGIPAGCQIDKTGNLWVADMRLGLLKIDTKTGACQQICERDVSSRVMQGCNDCVFDCYGNLWLTAPAGPVAPAPYTRSMQDGFGSLYCYNSSEVMKRIDTGYKFPNGIAIQYDETGKIPLKLIVAETPSKTLWAFPFVADETDAVAVLQKSAFGYCPGSHDGGPDGMDFDCKGNLLVANWGSGYIDVFGPGGGQPHTRIELPFKKVSNVHFKPGTCEVYVTEHDTHGLWMFSWLNVGAPHYCEMTLAPVGEATSAT